MNTSKSKILIIEADYYKHITGAMAERVMAYCSQRDADWEHITVPGAFEIPAAIRYAVRAMEFYPERRRFDGYVALGCVIRGETSHYDHICTEVNRGLMELSLRHCLAIGNGVLTVENEAQALARCGANGSPKDKGTEAANACFEMITLKRQFNLLPKTRN